MQHPGYLGSQDTFYVGTLKGVGRIYQQKFIDTYTKVADAELYQVKTALTAADMLNDRVVRFFEQLQEDLDRWLRHYNQERPHSGKYCFGKTPMQTFQDSIKIAKEKMLDLLLQSTC